ncbi:hypothetical protein Tdes44962_MAKER08107 [Teratosphaeria destructans]|uniref:Uncharacterized protein n=1 Tax=Teratosphaeria destructans TaxID=418781 RepID=A0A9W7SXI4_9PEZI|nr:hypothetical protein Tdes44962_MAKER08107 [Teratosphaeria destructans]
MRSLLPTLAFLLTISPTEAVDSMWGIFCKAATWPGPGNTLQTTRDDCLDSCLDDCDMNFSSAWINYDVKPSDIPPGRVVEPGTVWYDCYCAVPYIGS